ncbi:MAG: PmoA family protein, partial [Planctomycetota bacterium]
MNLTGIRSRTMRFLSLLLLMVLAVPSTLLAGTRLGVVSDPVARDLAWTPLSFTLRGVPELPGAKVRRVSDGRELPAQLERVKGGVIVHWVSPKLVAGTKGQWSIELLGKAPRGKDRVKVLTQGTGSSRIDIDGKAFSSYVYGGKQLYKPYFYPLRNPAGGNLTRHYPLKSGVKGERADHPHHRSLWFTHGEVNGVDFWAEGDQTGRIVHRGFKARESGAVYGRLVSTNSWETVKGEKILEERRDVRIIPLESGQVLMDFDITLVASEGDVYFGSTKEGSFGIRVAGTMKQTSGGSIKNSRGASGAAECWGKPAEWIDYYGPVDGREVGVTIMDHPASFRHPTHWHIRDYGLFAANPFGHRH